MRAKREPPIFKEGDRVTSVNFDGIRTVKGLWGNSYPHHYTVEPETGFAYEERWLRRYEGGVPVRVKVAYTVYGAKDSHGESGFVVTEDNCDIKQIVLVDEDGNAQYFEGDVRHLKKWCEAHGFTYFEQQYEREIEI